MQQSEINNEQNVKSHTAVLDRFHRWGGWLSIFTKYESF